MGGWTAHIDAVRKFLVSKGMAMVFRQCWKDAACDAFFANGAFVDLKRLREYVEQKPVSPKSKFADSVIHVSESRCRVNFAGRWPRWKKEVCPESVDMMTRIGNLKNIIFKEDR